MLCHVSWSRVLEAPHEQVPMGDSPEVARAGAGAGVSTQFCFSFTSEEYHVLPYDVLGCCKHAVPYHVALYPGSMIRISIPAEDGPGAARTDAGAEVRFLFREGGARVQVGPE